MLVEAALLAVLAMLIRGIEEGNALTLQGRVPADDGARSASERIPPSERGNETE